MFHPRGPSLRELARQALSSTAGGYDQLAPKFEYTPFRTPDDLIAASIAALTLDGPVGSAIDIGCGTGAALRHLRPACERRVVGLDFSAGMLAEARRRAADAPGKAVLDWVRADARQMPFDSRFDLAVCFGAMGHIPRADGPRFFSEIARVLVPGGRFAFPTGRRPSPLTPGYWVARGFNAAMRVRNAIHQPPFIMYYLRYLLPDVLTDLHQAGFQTQTHPLPPHST